jgi:Outer membrane protein beta-barrel domain
MNLMNVRRRTLIAALFVAMPMAATAQSTQTDPTPPAADPSAPNPQPVQPTPALTSASSRGDGSRQWIASGFLGSNFANNADPASLSYGGSIGYLWKKRFGAEADLSFSPSFQLQNKFFGLGVKPTVNTYMANAVGAIPIGQEGRFQPFISGGIGAISLRSGINGAAAAAALGVDPALYSSSANETRFGGNIGGGLLGFVGHWGFKADVRYFRATGSYDTGSSDMNGNPTNPGNPNVPLPPGYSTAPSGSRITGTTAGAAGTTGETAPVGPQRGP